MTAKKLTRTERERGIKKATVCVGTHWKKDGKGWIGDICQRKVAWVVTYRNGRKRGYCKECFPAEVPASVTYVGPKSGPIITEPLWEVDESEVSHPKRKL